MELIALFAISLTVYLASGFNMRGLPNDTLQQNLSMPVAQDNVAGVFSRVTNGAVARPDQFKYQVGLQARYGNGDYIQCGGSLISNKWVLTAAHCLFRCIHIDVYLGTLVLDRSQAVYYRVRRRNMIEHNQYNDETFEYDIGLIKIPRTANSPRIHPVDLAPRDAPPYLHSYVYLAGWGQTSDSSNDYSDNLLYASFRVISNEDCDEVYGSRKIYDGKICTATSNQISGCVGDSGSPLVLVYGGIQIGIYSFGWGRGCEEGRPDAYTRVSHYLGWINLRTGLAV